MIKFETGNGTRMSIPGGSPDDLELALELIGMSIRNEQRILSKHAKRLCDALRNMAVDTR